MHPYGIKRNANPFHDAYSYKTHKFIKACNDQSFNLINPDIKDNDDRPRKKVARQENKRQIERGLYEYHDRRE